YQIMRRFLLQDFDSRCSVGVAWVRLTGYLLSVSSSEPIYSIGAVSRMLGIPSATLRTWEVRYGVVVPQRSAGGQRLYTRSQIEELTFIGGAMDSGSSAADAHRVLRERVAEG